MLLSRFFLPRRCKEERAAMKDADGRAEEAKQRGNDAFRRSQFAEAIGSYTEAIMLSKDNPIYYLNRSMAYMKLNKCV